MLFLSCNIRISPNVNERLLSIIFTAKRIVLRIIWPILVIPLFFVFIVLIRHIKICPTDFVITLLVCYSLKVLVF
ncbi:hypothetical protein LINGRAHAP2_LOCUS31884 [Linum grandiflorum]